MYDLINWFYQIAIAFSVLFLPMVALLMMIRILLRLAGIRNLRR